MRWEQLVERLGLERHPEGGYFRETYRAQEVLTREARPGRRSGARACATAILYLLPYGEQSLMHRIASDEVWHFHLGDPLTVHILEEAGGRSELLLGADLGAGQTLQGWVAAGRWFGARHEGPRGPHGYSLVGCTVSPGFDFVDFEVAPREALLAGWPAHRDLIEALTPGA